jgi:cell division protein FtsL
MNKLEKVFYTTLIVLGVLALIYAAIFDQGSLCR